MQYKKFKDGIELSRLGLGAMRFPVKDGKYGDIDYDKAQEIVDECMKSGVNYYDTAYIYHEGKSEIFLGKALAKYPRESFYVADKYNLQANPDYKKQFDEQLMRLNMDYIDFYLLHGIQNSFVDEILGNGSVEYFDSMKKQGKIKYLGFSFHGTLDVLHKILEVYPWDFVQIQLNYYDWYFGYAKEFYEVLANANIPVMVMEPVHGGLLANMNEGATEILREVCPDVSLASWAMRWVKELDFVQVVLSGMTELSQVKDNIHSFSTDEVLTSEDHDRIKRAATVQHEAVAIACTACRYCCPDCPIGLDIPSLIKAYNEAKLGGAWRLERLLALPEDKRPTACINCGSCTRHCPQSFAIPDIMNEMKTMLSSLS